LEKLGFPWILSSEISLFNGLRAIFAQKNSRSPSPGVEGRPGRGRAVGAMRKGGIVHGVSLT
jgi:hypothetical protein